MTTNPSTEYHKIWVEQCAATEDIRERFGLESALDYLIGEKLFSFVAAAEQYPLFAQELPAFVAEIRKLFAAEEIRAYLDHLERTKFLAPPESDLDRYDLDEEAEEEPWPANPVMVHRNCCGIPVCGSFSSIEVARRTSSMAKPKRDPVREARIHNEAIVDAYGPEEQALSWYYYLEIKIHFPFRAKCLVTKVISPLRKGETVEVRRLAPEDACSSDMFVLIRWKGRKVAIPLSQLTPLDADQSTAEAIADWHYWVSQGYCF